MYKEIYLYINKIKINIYYNLNNLFNNYNKKMMININKKNNKYK